MTSNASAPNVARIAAGIILVLQAMVAFLLVQTEVEFGPVANLLLGVGSVGLNTLALYLNVRMPGQST